MKKAVFCLIFLIIMSFNAYVYADDANTVKIGLYYGTSEVSSVNITYDDHHLIYNTWDINDSVTITADNGIVYVNDKGYRGNIILLKTSSGLIEIINEVNIDDYVASVISKEMSPSFEIEALKAQAVAARTYAMRNKNKHKKYGFDLCASTDCQVYGGTSCEDEKTIKAAYDTAGQYLTYNGTIIDAVYSASSGGYTESAEYVWGNKFEYLTAVSDEYESESCYGHKWSNELSPQKATEIMQNKGYNVGDVTNIEIMETSPNGAVTKLQVSGTLGSKLFTLESCRNIFSSVTLSQAYTIKKPGASESLYTYNGKINAEKISLLSSNDITERTDSIIISNGNQTKNINISSLNQNNSNFVFNGRGYGHLVGMSQNGANGMAKAGYTYTQILEHYYKGTKIN